MKAVPRLIAVVHLGGLPGAPGYQGDLEQVVRDAVTDASILADSGFDAVLVENLGDAPYYPDEVPAATVAAMTRAVGAVGAAVEVPVGVNVLRNDALSALAVAVATGGSFIRVNVLTGTMFTDQGPITGRAADVARSREQLGAEVLIFADIFVKHAVPPPGLAIEDVAADTGARGGADALIVTGTATGKSPDIETIKRVRAVTELPLFVGSGVTAHSLAGYLDLVDGVIVGSALKADGVTSNPIDPRRVAEFLDQLAVP